MRNLNNLVVVLVNFSFVFHRTGAQVNEEITNTSTDSIYVFDDFDIVGTTLGNEDNGISGNGWFNRRSYASGSEDNMKLVKYLFHRASKYAPYNYSQLPKFVQTQYGHCCFSALKINLY